MDDNKYKLPRKHSLEMMMGRVVHVHCTNGYTTGMLIKVDEWGVTLDRGIKIDAEGDTVVVAIPWAGMRYISWDSARYET